MVCPYCRTTNDNAHKFCVNCGKALTLSDLASNTTTGEYPKKNNTPSGEYPKMHASTKLVQAKCTNCGAALTVNPSEDAAICPFCNSAFVVEKAIQNFSTIYNVNTIHNVKQDNEWTYKLEVEKHNYEKHEEKGWAILLIVMLIILGILYAPMILSAYK